MANSTTFKGAPKPAGKSGHFYEPQRHALQAKGIKTGNMSGSAVYGQMGIQNLEQPVVAVDNAPRTSQGLEDIQAEAVEQKRAQPKQVSVTERLRKVEKQFQDAVSKEKARKSRERKERLYKALDKPMPEEPEPEPEPTAEPDEDSEDEDSDEETSAPAKLGKFLADVNDDYTPEDMVRLKDNELEMLAVRFKTQNKDDVPIFGDPQNPFLEELKRRMAARDELAKEKAAVRAELRHPKKKEGLFDDFF